MIIKWRNETDWSRGETTGINWKNPPGKLSLGFFMSTDYYLSFNLTSGDKVRDSQGRWWKINGNFQWMQNESNQSRFLRMVSASISLPAVGTGYDELTFYVEFRPLDASRSVLLASAGGSNISVEVDQLRTKLFVVPNHHWTSKAISKNGWHYALLMCKQRSAYHRTVSKTVLVVDDENQAEVEEDSRYVLPLPKRNIVISGKNIDIRVWLLSTSLVKDVEKSGLVGMWKSEIVPLGSKKQIWYLTADYQMDPRRHAIEIDVITSDSPSMDWYEKWTVKPDGKTSHWVFDRVMRGKYLQVIVKMQSATRFDSPLISAINIGVGDRPLIVPIFSPPVPKPHGKLQLASHPKSDSSKVTFGQKISDPPISGIVDRKTTVVASDDDAQTSREIVPARTRLQPGMSSSKTFISPFRLSTPLGVKKSLRVFRELKDALMSDDGGIIVLFSGPLLVRMNQDLDVDWWLALTGDATRPVIVDDLIIIGDDLGYHGIRSTDGRVMWTFPVDPFSDPLVTEDGNIIVVSSSSDIYKLDKFGQVVNSTNVGQLNQDYIDIAHGDVPHGDSPHSDSAHADIQHEDYMDHRDIYNDWPYHDWDDSVWGHVDRGPIDEEVHSDNIYSDQDHADNPHNDAAHSDSEYEDYPHSDVIVPPSQMSVIHQEEGVDEFLMVGRSSVVLVDKDLSVRRIISDFDSYVTVASLNDEVPGETVRTILIGFENGKVRLYSAETGGVLWERSLDSTPRYAFSLGSAFAVFTDKTMYIINENIRTQIEFDFPIVDVPVYSIESSNFLIPTSGSLYIVSSDGDIVDSILVGSRIKAAYILTDGLLVCGLDSGIAIIGASKLEPLTNLEIVPTRSPIHENSIFYLIDRTSYFFEQRQTIWRVAGDAHFGSTVGLKLRRGIYRGLLEAVNESGIKSFKAFELAINGPVEPTERYIKVISYHPRAIWIAYGGDEMRISPPEGLTQLTKKEKLVLELDLYGMESDLTGKLIQFRLKSGDQVIASVDGEVEDAQQGLARIEIGPDTLTSIQTGRYLWEIVLIEGQNEILLAYGDTDVVSAEEVR